VKAIPDNFDTLHLILLFIIGYLISRYRSKADAYLRLWHEHKKLKTIVFVGLSLQVLGFFAKHFNDESTKR